MFEDANSHETVQKYLPSVLKTSGVPETLEDYTQAYGYLAPLLLSTMQKDRQVSVVSGPAPARPTLQIHQPVSPLSGSCFTSVNYVMCSNQMRAQTITCVWTFMCMKLGFPFE